MEMAAVNAELVAHRLAAEQYVVQKRLPSSENDLGVFQCRVRIVEEHRAVVANHAVRCDDVVETTVEDEFRAVREVALENNCAVCKREYEVVHVR